MATYKVLQDIEADDKLVGPLTMRQFVYGGIAGLCYWLSFLAIAKGAAFMVVILLPIAAVTTFFAWPWGGQQPTELWALAKVRYLVKPRKRIWSQSGLKELVTITVPKKVERILTDGLTQNEVRKRFDILANTIDSRGWAVKNAGIGSSAQPVATFDAGPESDRLVTPATLPQPVNDDVSDSDDMMDVQNNPVAQQFDRMITASTKAHRQQVIDRMEQATLPIPVPTPVPLPGPPAAAGPITAASPSKDYWFLNQPTQNSAAFPQDTVTFNTQVVAPGTPTSSLPVTSAMPTADEEAFIKNHKNEPAFSPNMHGHLHVIQPLSAQTAPTQLDKPPTIGELAQRKIEAQAAIQQQPPAQIPMPTPPTYADPAVTDSSSPVTQQADTGILDLGDLARNDDLNVATIAREANKRRESSQDEVVISLH